MEVQKDKRDLPPHIKLDRLTPNSIKTLKDKSVITRSPKKRKIHYCDTESKSDITSAQGLNLGETASTGSRKKRKAERDQEQTSSSSNPHLDSQTSKTLSAPTAQPPMLSDPSFNNTPQAANPAEEVFTTRNGTTLSFQNAGDLLTRWHQAIGQQSIRYQEYNVPPTQPATDDTTAISNTTKRRMAEAELEGKVYIKASIGADHPQDTLRECLITLPGIGDVSSAKLPEGGWANKKIARKSAAFESVKLLYQLGHLDDDLRYIPAPSGLVPSPNEKVSMTSSTSMAIDEQLKWEKEVRLSSKSKVDWKHNEQKQAIKSRLPPSPSTSPEATSEVQGNGNYPAYVLPPFWSRCPPLQPDRLYATTIELLVDSPYYEDHDMKRSCRKLCLITSRPLEIFDSEGSRDLGLTIGDQQLSIGTKMRLVDCGKMKKWEEGNLEKAMKFTERLLRAQIHTPFKGRLEEVEWLIVPLKADFEHPSEEKGNRKRRLQRRDISWDEIGGIAEGPLWTPLNMENPEELLRQCQDGMVTLMAAEFSKRRYIKSVRHDLALSSPNPSIPGKTIEESLPKNIPGLKFPDQPILELEDVVTSSHGGYITSILLPSKCEITYRPAEMVNIHCIPSNVFRTTTLLPYFFHELDILLIASELNSRLFEDGIDTGLLGQALTPPGVNTDISGNYERLEFLGDTILKFLTTVNTHVQIQGILANAGKKCHDRATKGKIEDILLDMQVILSNRSLQSYSIKSELNLYIRSKRLRSKDWLPVDWDINWDEHSRNVNVTIVKKKKISSQEFLGKHHVGDKVIADVLEAIFAASYLTSRDLDQVISDMKILGIPLKNLNKWKDIKYSLPPINKSAEQKSPFHAQEKYMQFFKSKRNAVLGYEFNDQNIVNTIFSLDDSQERKTTFERYRFIGNALLDYLVVEYLYDTYPTESPAALHHLKIARCGESIRLALCAEYGLFDFITDANDQTKSHIAKIRRTMKTAKAKADRLRSQRSLEDDELEDGGLEWWTDLPFSHSTIPDLLEALLGAILHDSSFDLNPLRKILNEKFKPFWEKHCADPMATGTGTAMRTRTMRDKNPKSELIEWLQSKGCRRCLVEKKAVQTRTTSTALNGNASEITGKAITNKVNAESTEEEVIVHYHSKVIASEKTTTENAKKTMKDLCKIALVILRDQNGWEKMCDCPGKKK
ncbi:uncharacterized protein I303_101276 [Kwoniella dejecticola CBS 10117]|uniref:RNase III domain-containing protein n=1 Tax=Kwoniella dejecticola CBS 10117 TaxID=1296121 RepID=A0AAJ8MF39_9TREE